MVLHRSAARTPVFCAAVAALCVGACTSSGIIVESVNNYGGPANLANSIANGDGFLRGMLVDGSPWHRLAHLTDASVWDTDFVDRERDSRGNDNTYFDQPGAAISYFTGHGIGAHGCSTTSCTTTATCTSPGAGARLPGTCRFSPFDAPRCCYMVDRALVTSSTNTQFNNVVDYTGGPIRFGESSNTGGWAQAGTNGGTNLVVLDISHGVLPPYWRETLAQAFAGVHMIATLMTAGGDTANVSQRGAMFASRWSQNEQGSVAQAWLDTMAWLPSNLGQACANLGGGRGFNGCGCHIVVAMDDSPQRTATKIWEDWTALRNDGWDGKGNNWYQARWLCNYTLPSGTKTAWERP
jgi:hypothetical protein